MACKDDQKSPHDVFMEYCYKLQQYYWQFFTRSQTFIEANKDIDPNSEWQISKPMYIKPQLHERGNYHKMSFEIQLAIMSDLDTIQAAIKEQTTAIIENIKKIKSASNHMTLNDYIRDSKGRKIPPTRLYLMLDKILIAYDDGLQKIPVKETAKKVKPPAHHEKSAINHIYDFRKKAVILIERAEKGTFPYSDKGHWELDQV